MPKSKKPAKYIVEVTEWASACVDIIALALVGSHARNEGRPDSDIDFVLICHDTTLLINNLPWVKQFGDVESYRIENWGAVTSIRVFYTDGQEIEFGVAATDWADTPVDEGTQQVVTGGMMILNDKTGILRKLQSAVVGKKAI